MNRKFQTVVFDFAKVVVSLMLVVILNILPAYSKKVSNPSDWKLDLIAGDRYLKSKELKKAEACYRDAVKEVRASARRKSDDEVLCLESLANVLYRQDFLDETLKLYKKSLSLLKRIHGPKSPRVIGTLNVIGEIYEAEGDFKKAEKYYLKSLEVIEQSLGHQSFEYGNCHYLLGRVKAEQNLNSEAEDSYFIAMQTTMDQKSLSSSRFLEELITDFIELMRKSEDDGKILKSKFQDELLKDDMTSLIKRKGVASSSWTKEIKAELAKDTAPEPLVVDSSKSGKVPTGLVVDTGDDTANSEIGTNKKLADLAALKKINQQRILFYERMIELDIKSLGPNHPSVARDLTGLATIHMSQSNYLEAKPLLQRALKIYESTYNSNSQLIKQTKLLLNLISDAEGPSPKYRFVSFEKKLPDIPLQAQKIEVALRLNSLAFMCYCQGKIQESKQIYYWALASTSKAAGERSLLAAGSMTDLSRLLRLTGRKSDAFQLESNARTIWRKDLAEKRASLLP